MKTHSLLLLLLSFVQVFPLFGETPYKEERRVIYPRKRRKDLISCSPDIVWNKLYHFPNVLIPVVSFCV